MYRAPPGVLPAFPGAKRVRPKTPIGKAGLRARWKDEEGSIYEWDYQHGTVERYDHLGRHEGEFHPDTGLCLKEADPTRRVEP